MRYPDCVRAIFQHRPNRFLAEVLLEGHREIVHVKNTGRCKELLVPGARVWLAPGQTAGRKTAYDLVTVQKGERLINLDSQAPNKVFGEWARAGRFRPDLSLLRPEYTCGRSRFDFYWEGDGKKGLVEVKGVTLEEDNIAYFPDAPTERGLRHLEELTALQQEGFHSTMCFVIQMDAIRHFSPNDRTHPQFGAALRHARTIGVQLLALCCKVTEEELFITDSVPILL